MVKVRIIFVDDHPQKTYYDFHVIYDGKWVSAYDTETDMMTYIPSARIHSVTDLGK